MDDWIEFYDSAHLIYVNARHRDVHFLRIAEDLAPYVPSPDATVVDYGCGEALHADIVAAKAARLILVEPAPGVRERLAARFRDNSKIEVFSQEQLAELPDRCVDLVIMHSVAQYLTPEELDGEFALFHRLLRPDGRLVVGDIIQTQTSALTDALALLRFGAEYGFFVAAVVGLARTLFSSYWRLRGALGLTRYEESAMIGKLATAGFSASREAKNIGHNPARMSFLARPV